MEGQVHEGCMVTAMYRPKGRSRDTHPRYRPGTRCGPFVCGTWKMAILDHSDQKREEPSFRIDHWNLTFQTRKGVITLEAMSSDSKPSLHTSYVTAHLQPPVEQALLALASRVPSFLTLPVNLLLSAFPQAGPRAAVIRSWRSRLPSLLSFSPDPSPPPSAPSSACRSCR